MHNFSQYVYFFSLHVSGDYVPIIRRKNCIYATLGICHSVWMTVCHAGCTELALFTGLYKDARSTKHKILLKPVRIISCNIPKLCMLPTAYLCILCISQPTVIAHYSIQWLVFIIEMVSVYIVRVIKSRRMSWAGHVARMGEERGVYRVLVGKPEGRRPLGRPRRRWVDNIRMDHQEMGCW